mmetsp:Transcript_35692/g.111672  ORF Transcript_35692/g.111672 Transcript_35692/m.111672 type:complete len:189 (+) Transcript_35692:798-1364(+)
MRGPRIRRFRRRCRENVLTCTVLVISDSQGTSIEIYVKLDWNPSDLNLLVVGTASGATFVVDRRKIGGGEGIEPLHKLHQHQEPVFRVGWRPDSTVHYASGGDDCFVCIWDISQLGAQSESMGEAQESKEVIFKHCGHRGSVQDLHWNPVIPWTLASVSEDAAWVILSEPFPPLSSSTPVCRSSSRSS